MSQPTAFRLTLRGTGLGRLPGSTLNLVSRFKETDLKFQIPGLGFKGANPPLGPFAFAARYPRFGVKICSIGSRNS